MLAPVHRLKKDEIVWLGSHRCKHGHSFLEHYSCFINENPERAKIGFFDIETSSLVADFGFVISWYILDSNNNFHGRTVTKKELLNLKYPDEFLMKELVKKFNEFDLIYGYNSSRFDLPFVRTRCAIQNIDFPFYGSLKHKDIYFIVKSKFRLHRKTQEVACEMLLGGTNKTHWMGKHWIGAVQGKEESLKYIDEHCRIDVTELKKLTEKVIDFGYPGLRSI